MTGLVTDILLDVEGTTSSISFVHDVLFPYARDHIRTFVADHREDERVKVELERARSSLASRNRPHENEAEIVQGLIQYIDEDVKDTALKALQGMIWRTGFESGAYRAHIYPEVPDVLAAWDKRGLRLSIYSSGSVEAQKLFFGHTEAGDLRHLLHQHFDTTVGGKKAAPSYTQIAQRLERDTGSILFLSDVVAELDAAREAGLKTVQLVRPGTQAGEVHPIATTLTEVEAIVKELSAENV